LACYHFVVEDACRVLGEEYAPFAARLWLAVAAIFLRCLGRWLRGHSVAVGPAALRWLQVGALTTFGRHPRRMGPRHGKK